MEISSINNEVMRVYSQSKVQDVENTEKLAKIAIEQKLKADALELAEKTLINVMG